MGLKEWVEDIECLLAKTRQDLRLKGCSGFNGGNISIRLTDNYLCFRPDPKDWVSLSTTIPDISKKFFFVTGSGKNIVSGLWDSAGIIEIDDKGKNYRKVYGFCDNIEPTSELLMHLRTHAVVGPDKKVVLHAHTPNLITITYMRGVTIRNVTDTLWKSHIECVLWFPKGVGYIPWIMSGSERLAIATSQLFRNVDLVLWQWHGVVGVGTNVDEASGIIDMAEKAAGTFIKTAQFPDSVKGHRPGKQTIEQIAANFKIDYNKNLLLP